jgi:hypothetical protein
MARIKAHVDDFKLGDFWNVASHMRQSDRDECKAYCGATPLAGVLLSLMSSTCKWTIRDEDGKAIGLFGVGAKSALSDEGYPWLLATDELEDISLTFLRQSKKCIEMMLSRHSFLENYVDERNSVSVKWLEWCGFKLDEPKPYGLEGRPFRRFEMRK